VSHWRASCYVQRPERAYRNDHSNQHPFGAGALFSTTAELTIRGGGKPYSNVALMPTERIGPPPGALPPMRMTASWSGSKRTYRIQVCGTKMRPIASSPSDPPRSDRQPPTRHEAMQKARFAVHRRSACSGVKALRNTSDARRQAAKLCYRFGPLTPSARSANLIAGDGTKNGFPAPNKEPTTNQNHYLTAKAPYKFESISLQQRVSCELDFRVGLQIDSTIVSSGIAERSGYTAIGPVCNLAARLCG
jgi:hypothetical protein